MPATERDGEFVPDLTAERPDLRETEVVGVARLAPTNEAGPGGDELDLGLVPVPAGLADRQHALVDPGGFGPIRTSSRAAARRRLCSGQSRATAVSAVLVPFWPDSVRADRRSSNATSTNRASDAVSRGSWPRGLFGPSGRHPPAIGGLRLRARALFVARPTGPARGEPDGGPCRSHEAAVALGQCSKARLVVQRRRRHAVGHRDRMHRDRPRSRCRPG